MAEELKFIPNGIKSEVYRSLLRLLIKTQKSNLNVYVADDLINERLILARVDQLKPELQEMLNAQTT